jgi:hypothetical protein
MAMTHINRWLVVDGKKLTKLQIVTLRLAVTADIKKARPTVRRKPPVQQPQAKIARRLKRAVSDLRKIYKFSRIRFKKVSQATISHVVNVAAILAALVSKPRVERNKIWEI